MKSATRRLSVSFVLAAVALGILMPTPCHGWSPGLWLLYVWPDGNFQSASAIGVVAFGSPAGDYPYPLQPTPDASGSYALMYREQTSEWQWPTGFCRADFERSVLRPGQSGTWPDFYLWAQNVEPVSEAAIALSPSFNWPQDDPASPPPPGYLGHLVIDQVAAGVDWTGRPMDYWFDLRQWTTITLPVAVLSDPSDPTCALREGTRFSITVYAPPVPEPASLAGLVIGLGPIGITVIRRKLRH